MKSFLKKSWFLGTIMMVLTLIIFALNFWVLSLKLTGSYQDDTLWELANIVIEGPNSLIGNVVIIAFVYMIAFYASILPVLLSIISLLKKKNLGFTFAALYFLLFEAGLIFFQSAFSYLSNFSVILIIINIVLVVILFIFKIIRKKALNQIKNTEKEERNRELSSSKIPIMVLLINLVAIIVFITTFFIPVYSMLKSGITYHAVLVNVLFSKDTNIEVIIYFIVNFVIFLSIFLYFSGCLSYYFFDKEKFINKSKTLINYIFVGTIIFFVVGLVFNMVYTIDDKIVTTSSYIPMLLMVVIIFIHAIFKGKFNNYYQIIEGEKKAKYARFEPLLYAIFITLVSVLMLLLPIIKIEIAYSTTTYDISLTGLDILSDYAILDPGYRMVAFLLIVMLMSVGLAFVITLTSYFSKYRQFNSIIKFAAMTNLFFVFIISISGYYFQIAKEINQDILIEVFENYGFTLPAALEYDYKIGTDAIYALLGTVVILILMFVRKAFDYEELNVLEATLAPSKDMFDANGTSSSSSATSSDEESFNTFDPCPAFTVLDNQIEMFNEDQERRKSMKVTETSLSDLTNFIVEYAKNSRLHLSYTPEDIATFVAGLGASRLSILQGMSGTGKTSLPKIFSEAVLGNCEIIEVESSWKDKHELLGYYNEFSMKYTPKKFTLALYKAALNQEIFTFILLDEMNLSRIEYYFSDFLSLMENEEGQREIKLINIRLCRKEDDQEFEYQALEQGTTIRVPSNIWFIGTANRDESTFVISDKVYDRAHTMNFMKRAPKVRNYSNPIPKRYYDYQIINELFTKAKQKGNFDAESNELIKQVEFLLSPYNISFGNRILKQIEDFVNIYKECFTSEDVENEAVEKILLSKVVAKLEVKTIDDKEKLVMEFEKLNLHQCAAFIKQLNND